MQMWWSKVLESGFVIKVKYNDALRRFKAPIKGNGQLNLDMATLRAKIFSLFSFPCDADITLSYVDEDGDMVTLIDDNDLSDVTRQGLKFLMINVQLDNEKDAKSHARCGDSCTPMISPHDQNPLPDFNIGDTEWLKSVPHPLQEALVQLHAALSKLSSKTPASNPVAAKPTGHSSKDGLSLLNQGQQSEGSRVIGSQAGTSEVPSSLSVPKKESASKDGGRVIGSQAGTSEVPASLSVPKKENASKDGGLHDIAPKSEKKVKKTHVTGVDNVTKGVGPSATANPATSAKPVSAPIDRKTNIPACNVTELANANPSPAPYFKLVVDGKNAAKKKKTGPSRWKPPGDTASSSSATSRRPFAYKFPFGRIPRGGYPPVPCMVPRRLAPILPPPYIAPIAPPPMLCPPIAYMAPPPIAPVENGSFYDEAMFGWSRMSHGGIRCNGCEAIPIVGPCYKSKEKWDYYLCSSCFATMGNEADYLKIEEPTSYQGPEASC